MNKERKTITILLIIGAILIIMSAMSLFFLREEGYTYTVAGYVVFGIGFGLLGDALGRFNSMKLEQKDPERMKTIRVEKSDERNISIAEKAKAKAFSFMTYLYAAVLMVLAIMRVELRALLVMVAAYLLVMLFSLFVKLKLYKEM